jgi:hypothetical protein
MEAMKIDLSDEEVKMIVEALEHYYVYTDSHGSAIGGCKHCH